MDVDNDSKQWDFKYWGLFENRPAKERTSAPATGQPQKSTAHIDKHRAGPLRTPTNEAEHVKC
jgi:hypothetical protein